MKKDVQQTVDAKNALKVSFRPNTKLFHLRCEVFEDVGPVI